MCVLFSWSIDSTDDEYQTARITDIETTALKTEMRGHDNRIECAVFVPQTSIPAVRELVALVIPFILISQELQLSSPDFSLRTLNHQR
jgi:hypothetical protein